MQAILSDALNNSTQYRQVVEEIKKIIAKKKKIVEDIKMEYGSEAGKIDTIKADLENDRMLLTDAALNSFVAGKTVEVEDSYGNKYEPIFSVKFKKAK